MPTRGKVFDLTTLRVAARYSRGLEVTPPSAPWPARELQLPFHVKPSPPQVPEGTDLAVWTWETGPSHFVVVFAGRSNRALLGPYAYRTAEERQRRLDGIIGSRRAFLEFKSKFAGVR